MLQRKRHLTHFCTVSWRFVIEVSHHNLSRKEKFLYRYYLYLYNYRCWFT